ncbi:MAG: hypothetical protein MJ233_04135 [Mycoplasmoidaceae bacterium]|nr:hypothetical protein [Mycoplasmoidaceae bacterium]
MNLAQALETSPADKQSIRISELTITGSGTSDAKVASDSTAKSDAGSETANFNFTMGSNSGKSLVDIDRSASTY